jgi:drug/metabolite transporter (DMT)-like permease
MNQPNPVPSTLTIGGLVLPTRWVAYAALATAGVLWGTSFLFGKMALEELGPATLIVYRFVLATAVLLPLAHRQRVRLTRRDVRDLALVALLMGPFMFWLQFEGLARTTASSAALLVGIGPPLLALGALLFDGERPGRRTWTAVLLSVVGTLLLVSGPADGRTLLGDVLVLVSMVAAVAWTLVARRLARRLGVLVATSYQFAFGALWLAPLALAVDGLPNLALSPPTWAAVVVLGLACTALTFGLWHWGLLHAQAAKAGLFANLEPVVGAALGVMILGEILGMSALAGGSLVLGAALLATTDPSAEPVIGGEEEPVIGGEG